MKYNGFKVIYVGVKLKQKQFGLSLSKHFCKQNNIQYLYYHETHFFLNKIVSKLKKTCATPCFLLTKLCHKNEHENKCRTELITCKNRILQLEKQLDLISKQYINYINNRNCEN